MPTCNETNRGTDAVSEQIVDYLRKVDYSQDAAQAHLFGDGCVADLEEKLASYYGMKYALCVSNATNGLLGIALALKLKDSEFITSPYSYGATIAGWLISGAKPVFADINAQTLTLDPADAVKSISTNTKAILAVDILGNPCDSVGLRKLADEFGLWYIADCAQSFGARRDGHPSGRLADALVISFTTGKTIFAGEGGAILTNNQKIYELLLWFTQHPYRQKRELGLGLSNEFSFNSRIHPMSAIWANATFESALAKLAKHQESCFDIVDTLNEIDLTVPIDFASARIEPSFFRLSAEWKSTANAAELENELEKRGLDLQVSHCPIELLYRQAAFAAQHGSLVKNVKPCQQAERQTKQRFCLTIKK